MEKSKKRVKRVVHAVSFDEDTYKALKQAAEIEGVKFGVYVKGAALNFTKAAIQHEQLLTSINPEDQAGAQQTFSETVNDLREVLSRTVVNSSETMNKRLDRLEKLVRRMIYVQLYYSREIPQEQKAAAQLAAKTRQDLLLKDIDTAPVEG